MSKLEKIENAVVEGYKSIENAVVEGYKKIEDGVVDGYKKIETGVVEGFKKVDNGRIEKMGEKAKERIAKEQAERTETASNHANVNVEVPKYDHEEAMKAQQEMIEKSIEASKNAGKR